MGLGLVDLTRHIAIGFGTPATVSKSAPSPDSSLDSAKETSSLSAVRTGDEEEEVRE